MIASDAAAQTVEIAEFSRFTDWQAYAQSFLGPMKYAGVFNPNQMSTEQTVFTLDWIRVLANGRTIASGDNLDSDGAPAGRVYRRHRYYMGSNFQATW